MKKVYDPAYKLEVCQTLESGESTVQEMSRETGISENTLTYQEETTKVEIYYIALVDNFLEYITKKFFDYRKDAIRSSMDMVESRDLYRKISTLICGEEKMEQLNLLIRQRFMFVSAMTAFLQGLTEDLLYALTHRDIETGKTVLQLRNND